MKATSSATIAAVWVAAQFEYGKEVCVESPFVPKVHAPVFAVAAVAPMNESTAVACEAVR